MNGYVTITMDNEVEDPDIVVSVTKSETPPKLERLQEVVGGLIESMFTVPSPFRRDISLTGYVNEEGLIYRLPMFAAVRDRYGVRPFAGNMVIVGLNEKNGETVLLTDEEIAHITNNFKSTLLPLTNGYMVERILRLEQ